jgi:uncharacterized protein (DUF2236 family)
MQQTRDVAAEAILLAGGARAILLQLANPAVGRGIAEHSDFADRPLDRLHGTLTYLYVVNSGTPDEVRAVARSVGHAHTPVPGARDTDLQLWVAATLYDTAVRVYELVFGPLSEADAQALLDQQAAVATTLGVPRAAWPATPEAFAAYWAESSAALRVDDPARDVARALLHPVSGPWWFRLLLPTVRTVTAGALSPELRAAYGLPFDERRFRRLLRVTRAVYPRLPLWVRHAPRRHYLRRFRRP